jgi:hypothetical protein
MSGTAAEEDDDRVTDGHVNGGTVSDDDVRAMLAQEKANSRKLKLELETERTGRNRAEQTASTHATARFEAEELAVVSRLEGADAAATGLKKDYAEALSEGRFDEAAEVQDKLAELRAKQQQDRNYKVWLEGEKARARAAPPQQEGVDLSQYSAPQRRWIRDNPEFMDDPKMRAKTFAGHQLAMAEGIEVDTPEYFEVINEVVHRGKRQLDPEDTDAGHEAPRRREAPAEIPVSRSSPRQAADRQRAVRLSADEMEAADITNPDIPVQGHKDPSGNWVPGRYEKYAIQRAKLKLRGQG